MRSNTFSVDIDGAENIRKRPQWRKDVKTSSTWHTSKLERRLLLSRSIFPQLLEIFPIHGQRTLTSSTRAEKGEKRAAWEGGGRKAVREGRRENGDRRR